ncbi:hypothetical protein LOC68_12805 [Blastopirellula sp. JC732]|uniref:Uncharacterized protein n=1 Tax=Blastopirellula sediminis TaxID=2894196 RepID=A0A9X1SH08_9BACT|nr:hypothetical protein [Blastopirellula sediminis]MCC9607431.1 hypothetical protein [Blastopirellula sediminis]MCC9629276.1 hypothetical protein [Blastopirellula sediminis]
MQFANFWKAKRLPAGVALLNFLIAIFILWMATGHVYWRFPLSMSILLGGIIDIIGQIRLRWREERRVHITTVEIVTLSTCIALFFAAANYDRKLQIANHRAGILGNIELLGGSYKYGENGLCISIDNPEFSDHDLPKLCAYLAMATDADIPVERLEIYRHAMTGRSRLLLLDMSLPHEAHIEGLPEKWEREYRDAHPETLVEFVPAPPLETEARILTTADVINVDEKEAAADQTAL